MPLHGETYAGSELANLSTLKLMYALVTFFGISMIILMFYDLDVVQRFSPPAYRYDEQNLKMLSRLEEYLSKEDLLESDWKELLELLEMLKMHKKALSKKPINQTLYREKTSCQPRSHIFFLKMHKAGSSTIMNMLFRYGEFHNLTFAFPKEKYNYMYPEYFSVHNVYGFSSKQLQKFNIMCHHMRFRLTEIEKVMPSDTFYFTILRNPETLMESSFAYNRRSSSFNSSTSLEDFLNNTSRLYRSHESDSAYAKNLMTFDLGFNHNGPESLEHSNLLCNVVDAMFDLVLMTEYFDESLVLLRHALCWTFDDVLSFPLNIRKTTSRHVLSVETKEKIRTWNQLDWQLYVYFNNSFWNRVDKFGRERMESEVRELRNRRAQVSEKCLYGQVEASNIKDKSIVPYQPDSITILGYRLKPELDKGDRFLCHRLVIPEIQYTNLLWVNQIRNKTKTHMVDKVQKGQKSVRTNLISAKSIQRKAKKHFKRRMRIAPYQGKNSFLNPYMAIRKKSRINTQFPEI
ncbi:galactose-3-O-sulfotransferase 2-like [Dendropsophus ebraccatus]|uniref:galactose-3-O-sulfotransferase 2-like n=1 Tax=Dendropsophus ebraccatus TaxID=150705 RepID=UPI0038312830